MGFFCSGSKLFFLAVWGFLRGSEFVVVAGMAPCFVGYPYFRFLYYATKVMDWLPAARAFVLRINRRCFHVGFLEAIIDGAFLFANAAPVALFFIVGERFIGIGVCGLFCLLV